MLSMYLAWSVYKLVGTLVIWLLLCGVLVYTSYQKGSRIGPRPAWTVTAVYLVIILFGAINVGDRQKELDRQRFDATMPVIQQQEKIESQRRTVESVKENFEQAVKHTSPKE